MEIDFRANPFSQIRAELRAWFSRVIIRAESDRGFDILRVALPTGSTVNDVVQVSAAIRRLFPERVERARKQKTEFLRSLPPFEIYP
jgi:hypothetical protein